MKRKILLILFVLLLTGCVRIDYDNIEYDKLILNVLNNDNRYTNAIAGGYQFYVPKGVRMIENDYNNQVFVGCGTKIYMYVDTTSYYYKNSLNYKSIENNNAFLKRFSSDDNDGFIEVKEEKDKYFIKIIYNYAKVEVYTDEYNINNVITLSTIILNSINYNDNVIKNLLEDNNNVGNDITYNIDKPSDANSEFSQYLEELIIDEETDIDSEQLPDEYDY